jgi:hypothetical protein
VYHECTCGDPDMTQEKWEAFQYQLIGYTDLLKSFIHGNSVLMTAIRMKQAEVDCSFEEGTNRISFKISCKHRFCNSGTIGDASDDVSGAWDVLESWGIFDLPSQEKMDFVIDFTVDFKNERGSRESESSERREVRITNRDDT